MSKVDDTGVFQIHVVGDVVVDHHIYLGRRDHPASPGSGTRIKKEKGGASLTANLLSALCADEDALDVHDMTAAATNQAFATWKPSPVSKKSKDMVWRVAEAFGFGEPAATSAKTMPPSVGNQRCDVLVIDEGGIDYRNQRQAWLSCLNASGGNPPWIVLKMSHPVCRGALWTELLSARYHDRLVVIVAADDLRRSGAAISQGLSWEQSVRDLLGDLTYHAELSQLARARHVVVNFGHDGALWTDNSDRSKPRRRLIYDPEHLEGRWRETIPDTVLGGGACLPAAMTRALFENSPRGLELSRGENFGAGIARGLAARRALLECGHGPVGERNPGYPYKEVIAVLTGSRGGGLSTVSVPDSAVPCASATAGCGAPEWSIIAGEPVEGLRPLMGRAREVARRGERALCGIPYGRFGKLYTVDRLELNGFYGIRKLMIDYVDEKNPGTPLCIGVFGPPGSGKSFGIKEIARGILGENIPILTFNLSQFSGPEMLIGALHQVRDEVLRGHVPVVFWDEFDSRKLEWLQYMLAPMNDGEFLEGQVTHPVGKCIFVFAGGTSDSFESFCARAPGQERQDFVLAKGPDFISRLKGYLNVLGPNPRLVNGKPDPADVGFPIRRAIMLRVQAKRFKSMPLTIDPGLLNAMLKIGAFKHGARSMATIVNLITGDGKRDLLKCNLPPREQLALHVDYDEFMDLVREGTMFKLRAEDLAPHVHDFYLELAKKEDWTPRYPMPYDELPDEIKQDNIAAARRIPDVLALVGLIVANAEHGPGAPTETLRAVIEQNIELLAEAEHDGWMEFKLKNNWRHGKERNDEQKVHNALIPYNDLEEVDKEKDRNSVRCYPEIVERAGFVIRLEGRE